MKSMLQGITHCTKRLHWQGHLETMQERGSVSFSQSLLLLFILCIILCLFLSLTFHFTYLLFVFLINRQSESEFLLMVVNKVLTDCHFLVFRRQPLRSEMRRKKRSDHLNPLLFSVFAPRAPKGLNGRFNIRLGSPRHPSSSCSLAIFPDFMHVHLWTSVFLRGVSIWSTSIKPQVLLSCGVLKPRNYTFTSIKTVTTSKQLHFFLIMYLRH